MALELNTYLKPPAKDIEVIRGVMLMLLERIRAEDRAAKGKERERERVGPDVPVDVGEGEGADEMSVG
jgi:hypothetical protein